jgi:hypothetical protein
MADLTPNEIARRLATNDGVIGPKFTISLEPAQYEHNPKYVKFLMAELRLISSMLEMFFAIQGLTKVSMVWENLNLVRRREEKGDGG